MNDKASRADAGRKQYIVPSVERVILDPVKEMLQGCPQVEGGKAGTACAIDVNFS